MCIDVLRRMALDEMEALPGTRIVNGDNVLGPTSLGTRQIPHRHGQVAANSCSAFSRFASFYSLLFPRAGRWLKDINSPGWRCLLFERHLASMILFHPRRRSLGLAIESFWMHAECVRAADWCQQRCVADTDLEPRCRRPFLQGLGCLGGLHSSHSYRRYVDTAFVCNYDTKLRL